MIELKAAEEIRPGQPVFLGEDGKAYTSESAREFNRATAGIMLRDSEFAARCTEISLVPK